MMKVVVATDSFKGSLDSLEAGRAIADGVRDFCPDAEVVIVPVADGGEGLLNAVISGGRGTKFKCEVKGPMGLPAVAEWGVCGDSAVIESAQACGLTLVAPDERDPARADSYGVGQLIKEGLSKGHRKFIVGLGGSAVNDGGTGMLRALGFRFLDDSGRDVDGGGINLEKISKIDGSEVIPELKEAEFILACDVTNPLTGPEGASLVYGPQKGASAEVARQLDDNMKQFARTVSQHMGGDMSQTPGAGAAGGLGFAFMSFLNARLEAGIDVVLDCLDFDDLLVGADLVFTGEGSIDGQTLMGKTPYGVLQRAKARDIPVIALGGRVSTADMTQLMEGGFSAVLPIVAAPESLEAAMKKETAQSNLRRTAGQVMRIFSLQRQ